MQISLTINNTPYTIEVAPNAVLVDVIREQLQLTGTHVGCDTSQCGACVVDVDGDSRKSCAMLAVQAAGCTIRTIEGVANPDGTLSPMQQAFHDHHALQCGFCTPGMVIAAEDLLRKHPAPSEATIRTWLEGNICRCTGYQNIVAAIHAVAHST
ncbi:MAG: (2Fe-2S)-binding protein [Actinomycetia bacterium]|nr:(2Fe-2S)-binding protein [Actinomycetes bacterium]